MNKLDRILHDSERDSLFSILYEMVDKGYSVEEQRAVLDAGLKSLERYHKVVLGGGV
jgi:hypothetical protein